MYANNSVIDINLVGEGFEGSQITDGGALECHTDDTTCCRGIDNPDGPGRGEWYYPNGTVVPPPGGGTGFYRTRGHMVIRLNRVGVSISPTGPGVYRCEVPGAGGVTFTRYVTLSSTRGTYVTVPLHVSGRLVAFHCFSLVIMQPRVMTYLEPSLTLHPVMYQVLFLLVSDTQEP